MPTPQIIAVVIGVSSFLGLISFIAYLFFVQQFRRAEYSVRQLIEGETLFNAEQVLKILAQFGDDASRLEALKTLTNHDSGKARTLLSKVQANVDVQRLTRTNLKHHRKVAATSAWLFLPLAVLALVYSTGIGKSNSVTQPTPVDANAGNVTASTGNEEPATPPSLPEEKKKPSDKKPSRRHPVKALPSVHEVNPSQQGGQECGELNAHHNVECADTGPDYRGEGDDRWQSLANGSLSSTFSASKHCPGRGDTLLNAKCMSNIEPAVKQIKVEIDAAATRHGPGQGPQGSKARVAPEWRTSLTLPKGQHVYVAVSSARLAEKDPMSCIVTIGSTSLPTTNSREQTFFLAVSDKDISQGKAAISVGCKYLAIRAQFGCGGSGEPCGSVTGSGEMTIQVLAGPPDAVRP